LSCPAWYGLEFSAPNIQNRIAEVEGVEMMFPKHLVLRFLDSVPNIQCRRAEVVRLNVLAVVLIALRTLRVGGLRSKRSIERTGVFV